MEFMGYKNDQDNLNLVYDSNGFLDIDLTKIIVFTSPCNDSNIYSIAIALLQKTDEYYEYHLNVISESNYGNSVATGDVKIYYDSVNHCIKSIFVNDIENADLYDKYGDIFDVSVKDYMHLLYKHYN
jgi:hypothetical protein